MPDAEKKYCELQTLLKVHAPFYLAFSGGLDSRFLAHAAGQAGLAFTAVHVTGPHVPSADTEAALGWLEQNGIPRQVVQFDPLSLEEVLKGSKKRCYQCKREMFRLILAKAGNLPVMEGSNASDRLKFRPGARALQELGILSPMAEVGLSKPEIRTLARETGLDNPAQPSRPCLLTRLDYGLTPQEGALRRLEAAEDAIAGLGFKNFRLRIFRMGNPILQIDWSENQKLESCRKKLERLLTLHGFADAGIQAEFEVSGFFDAENADNQTDDLEILKNLF